jgi:hypothetical protein
MEMRFSIRSLLENPHCRRFFKFKPQAGVKTFGLKYLLWLKPSRYMHDFYAAMEVSNGERLLIGGGCWQES